VDVSDLLRDLGGVARRSTLLRVVSRADIDRAVEAAQIVRDVRGLYALPDADMARRIAARLGGVLCLTSAALHHGWAVKTVPDRPHVLVSRGRKLSPSERRLAHVHIGEATPSLVRDGVTAPEPTLVQCLRRLPYDEALAIADSALRAGVGRSMLDRIADSARGPGSPQIRRVCERADGRAHNPFESALRAIAHEVPGLRVVPQVVITDGDGFVARPDLVDERLWLVIEADSFEWHGKRSALASDARRYNSLVVRGWIVLRFSYEDVMFHPEDVRRTLIAAVALAEMLSEVGRKGLPAA
jgi:very-short-patch-repair endonuclease